MDNYHYLIELLKSTINNTTPKSPDSNINWSELYKIASKHKVSSLVEFGLLKLPMDVLQTISCREDFVIDYKKGLVADANRAYQLGILSEVFDQNGINYIFLKGSVIKYLYPDCAMRPMNDIDILFKPQDDISDSTFYNKVYKIMNNLEYQSIHKDAKDEGFLNAQRSVYVELHKSLVDECYISEFAYLEDVWRRGIKETTNDSLKVDMTHEDYYIYHIIHMSKHFRHSGLGIIQFMDIWIYTSKMVHLDWEYIFRELGRLNLSIFELNVRLLAYKYFYDDSIAKDILSDNGQLSSILINPNSFTNAQLKLLNTLDSFISCSGAFGSVMQHTANSISFNELEKKQEQSKFITLLKRIFPSGVILAGYYSELPLKFPVLIPFYWIKLNFERLTFRRKEIKTNINALSSVSREHINATKELMIDMGLTQKEEL